MRELLSIGENIWIAEGNCVSFHGFPYPTRSVVVRLASGDVWVWSPIAKRADIDFEAALTDDSPSVWRDEIEQIWVRGSLFQDEMTFFHRPSRTLILADLSENFSQCFLRERWSGWKRGLARLSKIVEPWGYAPLEWRLSFLNRTSLRRAKARWIALDPANVVMAHGEWKSDDGRAYIQRAFAWV